MRPRNDDVEEALSYALAPLKCRCGHVNKGETGYLLSVDAGSGDICQSGSHNEADIPRRQLPSKMPECLRM
jgi:hypothetical protein